MTEDPVVSQILRGFKQGNRQSLIPALQQIQTVKKKLSRNDLELTADHFGIGFCKIYSIASFYSEFRFSSVGKYHIRMCRGTVCRCCGNRPILEMLQNEYHLMDGGMTGDGLFSLALCGCLGICGHSPNLVINDTVYTQMNPEKLRSLLDSLARKELENGL